jgi:hypothetical protein
MGLRTAGLLIEDADRAAVLAALPGHPRLSGARLSGDEALRMPPASTFDYAVAHLGRWTLVSDPTVEAFGSTEVGEELAGGGRAFAFLIHSTSTVYGFSWYVGGALVRRAIYVEGVPKEEAGQPLAEESGLPDPASEDHVSDLAVRLTGLAWAELFALSFDVAARTDGARAG